MRYWRILIGPAALLCAAVSTPAAGEAAPDLDFLAGDWALHDPSGALVGTSRIVVQSPGNMIYEERRVGDDEVQPLWFENSERNGGWTQLFVGPSGVREFTTLSKPGDWPMVLGADVIRRDGTPARFKLTMSKGAGAESRRILEMSLDKGKSWETVFDYLYRRPVLEHSGS